MTATSPVSTASSVLTLAVMLFGRVALGQVSQSPDTVAARLSAEVLVKDRELFDAIFTTCDTTRLRSLITNDLEFYHDRWGQIAKSGTELVVNVNGICERQKKGTDYRARREIVPSSSHIYPLAGYGALHLGEHRFFKLTPGKPEELTETASFANLWKKEASGEWRLARVISYAHRDATPAPVSEPTKPRATMTGYLDIKTPIHVAGISTRTTNARESDPASARLGALWGRFMREDSVAAKTPAAKPAALYSVYSQYESDVNGAYTVVIGRETTSDTHAAKVVTIPAGKYAEFRSTGEMPAAVVAGWQKVWEFFASPGAPKRAYKADFERYDPASPGTVWIYVGVTP